MSFISPTNHIQRGPFPAWASAAIGAGAGIGGTLIGGFMTKSENKKQRQYNENMWNKQNAYDQLLWQQQNAYNEGLWNKQNEYNERMWHMMNQYNSPMAQMDRFKEAGLNPNLIYGQTNQAPAITTAQQGRSNMGHNQMKGSPPPVQWNFDLRQGILDYYQFKEQAARTNNLEEQNKLLAQDGILKTLEAVQKGIQNTKGQIELRTYADVQKTSLDALRLSLDKTKQDMSVQLRDISIKEQQLNSNLRETATRILLMKGQTVNQALDAQLKQLDIELRRMGIQPTDGMLFRILGRVIGDYSISEFKKDFNQFNQFNTQGMPHAK